MSLFRLAVVLSLGIAVMPSDAEQQRELYKRAADAAYWTATFCDRNGQTCETAGVAWTTFVKKAEFASKLAIDVATRYGDERPSDSVQTARHEKISSTLRPEDLEPAWRGAERSRNGV